jgi:cobalt-zinc-cadmium efflux system membrane fusion protein
MLTRNSLPTFVVWIMATVISAMSPWELWAHEGHQPLPSKGVQVDTQNGHLTLSSQARDAIGLQSQEVVVGTVSSTLKVYAESVAPWQAQAFGSAQISGRIAKLLVRAGDFVSKNQVVAELSSRELEAVKLDFVQAENELALNQRLVSMTRPTAQAGAVPMQRLLELENALEQSENRLEIARVRAHALGIALGGPNPSESHNVRYPIRSPIAGQIIHSDLAEGKYVEAFEHLFEIVNTDQTWVRLQLLEKDVFKVAAGQRVELEFLGSSVAIAGEVDRIDASLDPQRQVSWAWMTIAHPAIVPGLVGKATIYTSTQDEKLTVPKNSVYSDGLQSYVFVEEAATRASGEYRKKNVKLGKRSLATSKPSEPMLEVLQGDIYPGDRVVVRGGHELSSLFFLGVLKLSDDDARRLGIATTPATYREIADTLQLPALVTLPPENRNVLSSQLDGTVYSHSLSPGREVRAGELLIEIASPDFYKLQLDLLTASLAASLSRRRADRLEEVKGDAVSIRSVLETQAQAEQLEMQAESLKRQLSSLGLVDSEINSIVNDRKILDFLPLRSTINGRIASSVVTLGETVVASQPLAEVHNLSSVWIEAHVPSAEIGSLLGDIQGFATMLANPEVRFPIALSRIGPVVNESTRTQSIWLVPQATSGLPTLRAGTLMSVSLSLNSCSAKLAVPTSAIVRDGLHFFTFVQNQEGYMDRRRVTTGRSDGEFVEILSGVNAGESVVSTGSRELQTAFASLR